MQVQGQTTLSPTEAAWLRLGGADSPLVTTALMILEGPLDETRLRGLIEDRLMSNARFRQCAVEARLPLGRPRWVERDNFELRHHLQRVTLEGPPSKPALEDLVSGQLSAPMDTERPLWQVLHVDMGDRSALVIRVHQAIGDCFSVVRLLDGLSEEQDAGLTESSSESERDFGLVDSPKVLEYADETGSSARTLVRLIAMRSNRRTRLTADSESAHLANWCDPLDLDPLAATPGREISPAALLLSVLARTIRAILLDEGGSVEPGGIKAVLPVDLRPEEDRSRLGSNFGVLLLPLAVDSETPQESLDTTIKALEEVYENPEAVVAFGVHQRAGVAMMEIEEQAMNLLGRKASLAISLIAGPRRPIVLAGCAVEDLRVWPPCAGRQGLSLHLLSYAGRLHVATRSSLACLREPAQFCDALAKALQEVA